MSADPGREYETERFAARRHRRRHRANPATGSLKAVIRSPWRPESRRIPVHNDACGTTRLFCPYGARFGRTFFVDLSRSKQKTNLTGAAPTTLAELV
jgi:hypothetical protein